MYTKFGVCQEKSSEEIKQTIYCLPDVVVCDINRGHLLPGEYHYTKFDAFSRYWADNIFFFQSSLTPDFLTLGSKYKIRVIYSFGAISTPSLMSTVGFSKQQDKIFFWSKWFYPNLWPCNLIINRGDLLLRRY